MSDREREGYVRALFALLTGGGLFLAGWALGFGTTPGFALGAAAAVAVLHGMAQVS